jgi:hypothetical protein
MRNTLIITILASFFVIFFSCKKEKEVIPPTKTELLVGHNWQVKAAIVTPAFPIIGEDYFGNFLQNCQKDDFLTFYTDNNAVRNEGGSKCNTGDAQTTSATWAWQGGETQLLYIENGNSTLYSVISAADSAMVLTNSLTYLNTTFTITSTWKKP